MIVVVLDDDAWSTGSKDRRDWLQVLLVLRSLGL